MINVFSFQQLEFILYFKTSLAQAIMLRYLKDYRRLEDLLFWTLEVVTSHPFDSVSVGRALVRELWITAS